jgi:SMP-30/Gluconolactonase/LRE-like region
MSGRRAALSAGLAFALLSAASAYAEVTISSLTGVIEGHEVGGLTIDMIGNVYAADFGDVVWRITPEGERREFVSGLYGTAGNAIDNRGNLLQASFYAGAITQVDRNGKAQALATRGLGRPAGIAVDRRTGAIYVTNCRDNSVAKVDADGTVSAFARSELFNCPYGIALDRTGNIYAVNYRDNRMMKIDAQGMVSQFARVSAQGMAHLCFKDDRFYVSAFWSHEIYEVTLSGTAKRILGTGERAIVDGTAANARLSFPMGIACHPWAPRLYVNEDANESGAVLPRRSIIRVIALRAE